MRGMDGGVALRVDCQPGHQHEPTPVVLWLGERRIHVAAVLDAWFGRDHRYFKVQGDDGGLYIVRHDVLSGDWELTLYEGHDQGGLSSHPGHPAA